MASYEEILSTAQSQGMVLVDPTSGLSQLISEFIDVLSQVDALCDVIDPEAEPYRSKYQARTLIDSISNKLEANRTVAMLEKKRQIVDEIDYRLAYLRVKCGVISYEVEEPHNAQTELELACHYYVPGFVDLVNEKESETMVGKSLSPEDINELQVPPLNLVSLNTSSSSSSTLSLDIYVDAMKCLNMMGILWAGRGSITKSFCYLLSAKKVYELIQDTIVREKMNTASISSSSSSSLLSSSSSSSSSITTTSKISAGKMQDMESTYTHTLFYLAQAYGHCHDVIKSSQFCHETLQRQFDSGLVDYKSKCEWAKNCAAMADFYQSSSLLRKASMALLSAEIVLKDAMAMIEVEGSSAGATPSTAASSTPATSTMSPVELSNARSDSQEQLGDLHKRFVTLDLIILKRASDRIQAKRLSEETGTDWEEEDDTEAEILQSLVMSQMPPQVIFRGIDVLPLPLMGVSEIDSFDTARVVFLRALTRIEQAKKIYPLDGCVTEHVNLLLSNSKLYHYLSSFEIDVKRKLAMETRRVDMLQPLLGVLSKSSYEALHKTIAYELGETFLALLEIKLDKLRGRAGPEGIDERHLKKAEIAKINEYCKGALCSFVHFSHMYTKTAERQRLANKNSPFEQKSLVELKDAACMDPDEGQITEEEIRPFLNCHFLSCRAFSKIIVDIGESPQVRSQWMVASYHRYLWLAKFARELCSRKEVDVQAIFGAELQVCDDLSALLPSKINRMHYYGESGLSM